MIVGFTFVIVMWFIVLGAEICKSNGFYRGTSAFRVFTMLYAQAFIVYGFADSTRFLAVLGMTPFNGLLAFGLAGGYSTVMFLIELYQPHKYYPTYLDVPRQVLYKVGKFGKCIVLSEKEAKQAHKNGETVYIHAMARVTYKPKDEESPTVGMDKGVGKDWSAVVGKDGKPIVTPQHPVLSEDILTKLKDVQAQIEKRKGMQR